MSVKSLIFIVSFEGLGRGSSSLIFVILYFSQRGPQVVWASSWTNLSVPLGLPPREGPVLGGAEGQSCLWNVSCSNFFVNLLWLLTHNRASTIYLPGRVVEKETSWLESLNDIIPKAGTYLNNSTIYTLWIGKNNWNSHQIVNCDVHGERDYRGLSLSTLHMSTLFTEAHTPFVSRKKMQVSGSPCCECKSTRYSCKSSYPRQQQPNQFQFLNFIRCFKGEREDGGDPVHSSII